MRVKTNRKAKNTKNDFEKQSDRACGVWFCSCLDVVPRGHYNVVFTRPFHHFSSYCSNLFNLYLCVLSTHCLEPLNKVTSTRSLCPREHWVLSAVRTHCSSSEEEEITRLEDALATAAWPLKRQRDTRENGERQTCKWEKVLSSPIATSSWSFLFSFLITLEYRYAS